MTTHLQGVAASVSTALPSGLHVYDTEAERPDYDPTDWESDAWDDAAKTAWVLPDMYVVLAAPAFRSSAFTIDGARTSVGGYFQATAVGLTAEQTRLLHTKLRDVLDGGHPMIAGFYASTRMSAEGIVAIDKSIIPHRAFAVDTYRYDATPA